MSRRPRSFSRPGGRAAARGFSRVPAELSQVIATTHDRRDITRPYTTELEEFADQRLLGEVDWGPYDRILLDDQVKSCLEQRRSAVVSREWSAIPGDDQDPRAAAAAEALQANLERIGWDRITDKMLYAPFYGIAAAELMWEARDGLLQWSEIRVRHARRFRKDRDGRWRLITTGNIRGEVLPDRKFWFVTAGASDDDQPYGRGLAEWLFWPCLFKRNSIRFWNAFLDKFAVPTAKGIYPKGTPREEIDKLLAALAAIANDTGVALPEGMAVELLQVATNGIDFDKMPAYMDAAIAKIILSQTMTTDNGASRSQAEVHGGVKQELIAADADLLTDSFTTGPSRWFTDLNFGTDVAAPIVLRQVEEEADLKSAAETDLALSRIGWRRSEESFRDIYGEGFERADPAEPPAGRGGKEIDAAPDDELAAARRRREERVASFAEPRPLYVYRRLRDADALAAWAKAQGFASILPASDLHVTVCYSRRPVDWFAVSPAWGGPDGDGELRVSGGARAVERLGKEGAVALMFASSELEWRHKEFREAGAGWDFADYRPHVTLSYAAADLDLSALEPYQGELVFGPEIFEPLDDSWSGDLTEISFAEPTPGAASRRDAVDEAVAAIMAEEGWQEAPPLVRDLVAELAGASDEEEVRRILARSAELDDEAGLAQTLERAGFAVRLAAATGSEAK